MGQHGFIRKKPEILHSSKNNRDAFLYQLSSPHTGTIYVIPRRIVLFVSCTAPAADNMCLRRREPCYLTAEQPVHFSPRSSYILTLCSKTSLSYRTPPAIYAPEEARAAVACFSSDGGFQALPLLVPLKR